MMILPRKARDKHRESTQKKSNAAQPRVYTDDTASTGRHTHAQRKHGGGQWLTGMIMLKGEAEIFRSAGLDAFIKDVEKYLPIRHP